MKDKKNPLSTLWNIIGTIGGVISLSSLAENWAGDLVKWKGFILSFIESYRLMTQTIMDAVFFWLPFHIPQTVSDYIVLGVMISLVRNKLTPEVIGYTPNEYLYSKVNNVYDPLNRIYYDSPKSGIKLYFYKFLNTSFIENLLSNPVIKSSYIALVWPYAIYLDFRAAYFEINSTDQKLSSIRNSISYDVVDASGKLIINDPKKDKYLDAIEKKKDQEKAKKILQWLASYIFGLLLLLSFNSQL